MIQASCLPVSLSGWRDISRVGHWDFLLLFYANYGLAELLLMGFQEFRPSWFIHNHNPEARISG
jgi:hypothetical protein